MYKVSRAVKKQIHTAVENLPELFYENIKKTENTTLRITQTKPALAERPSQPIAKGNNPAAKRLMYFGVICLMVVIFVMWGLNIAAIFANLKSTSIPEKAFVSDAKTDVKNILTNVESLENNSTNQSETIKNILKQNK